MPSKWCILVVMWSLVVVGSVLGDDESYDVNATFSPNTLDAVAMGSRQTIAFNVSVNCDAPSRLFIFSQNTQLALIENSQPSVTMSRSSSTECFSTGNFTIEFRLIGKTFVDIYAVCGQAELMNTTAVGDAGRHLEQIQSLCNESLRQLNQTFELKIIRTETYLDGIFVTVLYVFIVLTTIGMGMKTDLGVVKSVLKRPIAPAIGFACQYVLMPLVAFGLAKAVNFSSNFGFALFVSGCCPGGSFSNLWTYLLKGDVTLSVTMTLISTIASLALLPFWIFTLGQMFIDDKFPVHIPFLRIFWTLLSIVIPVGAGLLANRFFPRVSKWYLRIMTPVFVLLLVVYLGVGIYINSVLIPLITPAIMIAGSLLPVIGFLFGGIIARVCQQSKKRCLTIGIETGIQNYGIAILILKFSLPPPESDISLLPPMLAYLFTPIPLFIFFVISTIYRKCCKKPNGESSSSSVSAVSSEDEHDSADNKDQVKMQMLLEMQPEESKSSAYIQ